MSASEEKRHSFRNSLFMSAPCRIEGLDGEVMVKLRNISEKGVMAEGLPKPREGAMVSLQLRNLGWVEGSIAWVQNQRFGIIFARDIDPAIVKYTPPTSPACPDDLMTRRPLHVRLRQIEANPTSIRRV
ncbi:MAG: PilZ domain-containing protein [Sphingomonadales bacterium]|nr:PilZ domain-containing protein [Sphingomonadales bacterium]MDE2168487.1 PilZ domain-containing protein [Sphingomonadales bacterium]